MIILMKERATQSNSVNPHVSEKWLYMQLIYNSKYVVKERYARLDYVFYLYKWGDVVN